MSTLAHVFEAAGLSTIVLASMKEVAERIGPPRTLYCEFPLGRPLGKPGDAEFQTDVIRRGLALLDATEPVFETHPTVIESDETPMSCAIPPRFDPDLLRCRRSPRPACRLRQRRVQDRKSVV